MKTNLLLRISYLCICFLWIMGGTTHAQEVDPTENIAVGKDAYASSNPERASQSVDGNNGTRWESQSADGDNVWWYVDLGYIYELNHIEILWEGAYAKSYEIQVTNEIAESGVESTAWRTIHSVKDQQLSGFPYEQDVDVAGQVGRYVKFQGIERGTQYGYSFFEFRVFANRLFIPGEDSRLTSVAISLPSLVINKDHDNKVLIIAYDQYYNVYDGATLGLTVVDDATGIEVIEKEGEFYLHSTVEGDYQLVATAKEGEIEVKSEVVTVTVREMPVPQSISIKINGDVLSPIEGEIPVAVVGRALRLSLGELKDQFGNNYPDNELEWIVEGAEGTVENYNYISSSKGVATIYAQIGEVRSNEIIIKTVASGENIALGKPVEADEDSEQENAPNAVDGNDGTLWTHPHPEGEDSSFRDYEAWIIIDLEAVYENIELVEVYWEGARAADYSVTFSLDGENYQSVGYDITSEEGVLGITHQFFGKGAAGRYIKVHSTKAATQYGVKIREVRAYVLTETPVLTAVKLDDLRVIVGDGALVKTNVYDQFNGDFKGATVEVNIVGNNVTGITLENREGEIFVNGIEEGTYQLKATARDNNGVSVESEIAIVNVLAARKVDRIVVEEITGVIKTESPVALFANYFDQYGEKMEIEPQAEWKVEGSGKVIDNAYVAYEIGEAKVKALLKELESEPIVIKTVAYNKNIALNKEVFAIGENLEANMGKEKAVDGDEGTRWTYNPPAEENVAPFEYEAWITVDLGEAYDVDMVEIVWEGAIAADYGIYYSMDNENFGEAAYSMTDVPGLTGATHQFHGNPAKARYVKMHSTKAATQYGVSMWEFKVFGTKDLIIEREGTHLILEGLWSEETFAAADAPEITSYDMKEVVGLTSRPSTLNPNSLIYVNELSVLAEEDNVVAGNRAERITLTDGFPYNNIQVFTANEVEYVRNFADMSGWTTLYLPFTMAAKDRNVEALAEEDTDKVMFEKVTEIKANIPYLLEINNNQTFTATSEVEMPISENTNFPVAGGTIFKGTFTDIAATNTHLLNGQGTAFVAAGDTDVVITPFRGYIETSQTGELTILHHGEWTPNNIENLTAETDLRIWSVDGELRIYAPKAQQIIIYGLEGRVVNKMEVTEGLTTIYGLVKGIYIINDQKVFIK